VIAPALKASSSPPASEVVRGLRGADVGAHRDVHADEAGRARQDGADGETDRNQDTEEVGQEREDDDADDGDGGVWRRR